jgi:hypothetical protein
MSASTWTSRTTYSGVPEGPEEATATALKGVSRLLVAGSLPVWSLRLLEKARPGMEVEQDPGILPDLRERKEAEEVELIRRSGAITDETVSWVGTLDLESMTERQLAGKIMARYLDLGHEPSPHGLVASGENAAMPHYVVGDVPIRTDRPLLMDFGCAVDGYWSDITDSHGRIRPGRRRPVRQPAPEQGEGMNRAELDPFTTEIIKNGLVAIGDEMFYALQRTSKSPIIYETLDYAVGATDAKGNLIAQGNGVTGFLGTLDTAVQGVLEKFGGRLYPGDIVITNDRYGGGGTHLSDVSLIMPVFYDGDLVAFMANKAHWTEVGGQGPGLVDHRRHRGLPGRPPVPLHQAL